MKSKSFVSINDLTREKILSLLETAEKFEENPNRDILKGKIVGSLFLSHLQEHASVLRLQPTDLARASSVSAMRQQVQQPKAKHLKTP